MQSKDMPPYPVLDGISPRANFEGNKLRLKILQDQTPEGRAYSSFSENLDPLVQS